MKANAAVYEHKQQNFAELTQYAKDMQYIKMIKKVLVISLIVINICEIYSFVVS